MFKLKLLVAITTVGLIGFSKIADAGYLPQSMGLVPSIKEADVVALCRITSVLADVPATGLANTPPSTQPIGDIRELVEATALQPASTYKVHIIRAIKGSLQGDLEVHLPLVSAMFYYDNARFDVGPGICCLLLLSQAEPGRWVPVDRTVPLIPLGNKVDPKGSVMDLMLASLTDPGLRRANTYLLRRTRNAVVAKKLSEYAADTDVQVRMSVLRCMASNQDISAIPLIVSIETQAAKNDGNCSDALGYYQTSAAVPLLNEVIVGGPDYCRRNALLALRRLADNSSTPFLVKAMTEVDDFDSFEAYVTLHRLIGPAIGPMASYNDFLTHRVTEIESVKNWVEAHPTNHQEKN